MGTIAGALEDLPKALKRVLKARRKFEKAIDRLTPITQHCGIEIHWNDVEVSSSEEESNDVDE